MRSEARSANASGGRGIVAVEASEPAGLETVHVQQDLAGRRRVSYHVAVQLVVGQRLKGFQQFVEAPIGMVNEGAQVRGGRYRSSYSGGAVSPHGGASRLVSVRLGEAHLGGGRERGPQVSRLLVGGEPLGDHLVQVDAIRPLALKQLLGSGGGITCLGQD